MDAHKGAYFVLPLDEIEIKYQGKTVGKLQFEQDRPKWITIPFVKSDAGRRQFDALLQLDTHGLQERELLRAAWASDEKGWIGSSNNIPLHSKVVESATLELVPESTLVIGETGDFIIS